MLFELLRSYRLEAEGPAPDQAEAARVRFMRASHLMVQALREAQAGAAHLHD